MQNWWVAVQYASSYGQNTSYFFYFVCFCTYSWPYPSYLASPVLVNPSKLIFLIITSIQNVYCIVICPENIISSNLFFLNFSEPERTENNKFLTHSIWLVYLFLTHIFILSVVSVSQSQQKSIFLPYTASPKVLFH